MAAMPTTAPPTSLPTLPPGDPRRFGGEREPAADLSGTAAERLVVLVAPANGRFSPALVEGAVAAGDVVAHVAGGRGRRDDVRSPVDATLRGLLTRPGQLVVRGDALAWAVVSEGAPA